ncbi:hypothetical protein C343_01452 [Cryptococcus neoformans C23]|uniref:Uncharacterized protein n=1 Tax=Cryptococcus neoformans (strain H99 / ATCC 208821 / CBS 10515 / FGSC 9487) TaxID=235443 RepID=J9VHB1_CRYN9|nr:hypothetical protein CNAG_04059 [Cryptococcus neoformans var. grubii H99]AFR93558.1 hypothetical protein CNAG_04059 [Cryptococcus neoformans var. grubii H99]AUB23114.1 hypothetical protein CKF44_04059 [Cryptococcus neoformans var. grubii]OWZ47054.1 hypothetical protein C343_01452 [Cryptococcus neoformans var. grubii C23]|eukprot:XP_012047650.1 hypothetical protein CNAG_04059 [Cryptococcus neoformans var. grubii H99]
MPRSSNPRASRTNDVIEAGPIEPEATSDLAQSPHKLRVLRGRQSALILIFGDSTQCVPPPLPSEILSDGSVSDDISILRFSTPAGRSTSSPGDAYPSPLSGQETSQGGLAREPLDIDDAQGYDDLPAIMMDESLLEAGFEGDGYGGVIRDSLGHQLSKWPTKVPESLIPPYSCRQPNPYQDEPIFRPGSAARSMPLLVTVLAVFSIFLTAFAGLPQRLGDLAKAVIQRCAGGYSTSAISRRASVEKTYRILNLPVETSSSRLRKNAKTLYGRKVYVRIGTISCHWLASVAVIRCVHFRRKDSPCLKTINRTIHQHLNQAKGAVVKIELLTLSGQRRNDLRVRGTSTDYD